jgi:hypothetical protein
VERESEESVKEALPRARGEEEEEELPVARDVIEKTNNLPPKPSSPQPQLDRFVPLSDHIMDNLVIFVMQPTVKNHSEIFKTLKFFLRISI